MRVETHDSPNFTFTKNAENEELITEQKSSDVLPKSGRFIFGGECWSQVAGHRMRYLRAGSGRPVVLIHGLLGYSFSWRFNWEVLAKEFTVYAPDLLGIGYSDRPAVGSLPYDLLATADRMLDWMELVGLQNAVLVGTSHGGGLALVMAGRDRQQKRGLIGKLVSVAGVNPWTPVGHLRAKIFGHPIGSAVFKMLAPFLGMARLAMLERMYGDNTRITQETIQGYREPLELPRSLDYGIAIARNWERDLACLPDAVEQIGDLPTLLIWGAKDKVVPLVGGVELKRHLKNSEMAIMEQAGHLPYEEYPEEFNRILLEFLRR